MVLNVLLVFEYFREFLIKNGHANRKHIQILIEILIISSLIIFILIQLLSINMIILRIESQSFHPTQKFIILIH